MRPDHCPRRHGQPLKQCAPSASTGLSLLIYMLRALLVAMVQSSRNSPEPVAGIQRLPHDHEGVQSFNGAAPLHRIGLPDHINSVAGTFRACCLNSPDVSGFHEADRLAAPITAIHGFIFLGSWSRASGVYLFPWRQQGAVFPFYVSRVCITAELAVFFGLIGLLSVPF